MSVCVSLLYTKCCAPQAVEWVWCPVCCKLLPPASTEAGNHRDPAWNSVVGALHPAVTSCLCCLLFSSFVLCEVGAVKIHGKECKRTTGKKNSLWKEIPVQTGKGKLPRVF